MRSLMGSTKMRSGGPSSWTTPPSRKQTLEEMSHGEAHLVAGYEDGHALGGEVADDAQHLGDEPEGGVRLLNRGEHVAIEQVQDDCV